MNKYKWFLRACIGSACRKIYNGLHAMILTIINTNDILYGHTCPCADHIIGLFLPSTGKVYHAAIALSPSWIFKYELEGLASIYKLQSEPNLTEEVCKSSS